MKKYNAASYNRRRTLDLEMELERLMELKRETDPFSKLSKDLFRVIKDIQSELAELEGWAD